MKLRYKTTLEQQLLLARKHPLQMSIFGEEHEREIREEKSPGNAAIAGELRIKEVKAPQNHAHEVESNVRI